MERINSVEDFSAKAKPENYLHALIDEDAECKTVVKITFANERRLNPRDAENAVCGFGRALNVDDREADCMAVIAYSESENTIEIGLKSALKPESMKDFINNGYMDGFAYIYKVYSLQVNDMEETVFTHPARPRTKPEILAA